MSTFGGIQQALSSLQASQYGLQVVSQNIGNASTPGYTRQGVELAALDTVNGVPRRYVTGGGPSGVTVTGTARLNDPIVDARARMEHARSALTDTTTTQLSQIENVFGEPSDTGLSAQLNQFWSDWANVANNPADGAGRTVLLQDASSVADTLNAMSQSLKDVGASTINGLAGGDVNPGAGAYGVPTGGDLAQANTAAKSLAELNTQIALAYNTSHDQDGNAIPGSPDYNGLLDQRDQLLDKLSSLVGGVATINRDGTADVRVGADPSTGMGGTALVTAAKAAGAGGSPPAVAAKVSTLVVNTAQTDGSLMVALRDPATSADTAVALTGGSAAASVATLTDADSGLPHFESKLDAVAQALAKTVNDQQAKGAALTGGQGQPIFGALDSTGAVVSTNVSDITASNIGITAITPDGVAAAAAQVDSTGTVTYPASHDGSNALALSKSGSLSTSPDRVYADLVGDIGTQSQLAQRRQATQDAITSGVDALRQSASGVNLDEEVSNMLTLQHTYQASSRVLSIMDSMLDTLINQMGVG